MHYERLLLDDFGIFQRAELRDLEPGLTVIAGPQRAGKTTFMQAVRQLGYGVSRGADLPPAGDTYRLGAELAHDEGTYRLDLEGYGDPYLSPVARATGDVPRLTTQDVFGALTKRQYRQLYTLSLDQLQRLPPTIDEPEDLSRVLLGAAYGSIADLPDIIDEFDGLAYEIGRKTGRPQFGAFSDAYETIETAQADLEEANRQVEAYEAVSQELAELESALDDLDAAEQELEARETRLETVQRFYDDFQDYRRLEEELSEVDPDRHTAFPDDGRTRAADLQSELRDATADVEAAAAAYEDATTGETAPERRETLVELADQLERYENEITGWEARLDSIDEATAELDEQEAALKREITRLNTDWDGEFAAVERIDADLFSRDAVADAVGAVTEARAEQAEIEEELSEARARRRTIEEQLETTAEDDGSGLLIAGGAGIAGVVVAIGLAAVVGPAVGAVAGALLVVAGLAVARRSGVGTGGDESQRTQLEARLTTVEEDIAALEERHEGVGEELEGAEQRLDEIREELEAGAELTPEGLKEFHETVTDLQRRIEEHQRAVAELHEEREALRDELQDVAATVGRVHAIDAADIDVLDSAESLFAAIEQVTTAAELATDWAAAKEAQAQARADAIAFLEEWETAAVDVETLEDAPPERVVNALQAAIDEGAALEQLAEMRTEREQIAEDLLNRFRVDAVREAFAAEYDPDADASVDAWYLDAFEQVADRYTGPDELNETLNEIEAELDELDEARSERNQEKPELEQQLEQLASEDDLIEAQRRIQAGSRTIERLGEEYATYRIAESITQRLYDRFIQETTEPLLDEASEIFTRITAEYDAVDHTGELEALDFEVEADDGSVLGRSELSRATAEQLFMAVRLARIRRIDTPLPVVLDDALTNFDPAHSARTMALVDELARTNQVFFLTAHPSFVRTAAAQATVSQFWRIEDGRFDGPFDNPDPVVEGLDPDLRTIN